MSLILNIETSTKTCSVNLSDKGKIIEMREVSSEKFIHGEKLHLLIQELFASSNIKINKLNAVAVSSGPGSFTGLRIGVAAAKGLSFALKIPLISMNAIEIMIQSYNMVSTSKNAIFFPMIDARRNEVYTAGYNTYKTKIWDINCPEINEDNLPPHVTEAQSCPICADDFEVGRLAVAKLGVQIGRSCERNFAPRFTIGHVKCCDC